MPAPKGNDYAKGNRGNTKSRFNDGIKEDILAEIVKGRSLRSICEDKGMPVISTVMKWVAEDKVFSEQYACAREERAEYHFEECLTIADGTKSDDYQVNRLRIDTRKWMVGKMAPKKYGDKIDLTSSDGSMSPKPLPWDAMYEKKQDGGDT